MRHRFKRGLSLLLSVVMVLALLPAAALAAGEDEGAGNGSSGLDQVAGGINGYMAALTADADTSGGYEDAFTATGSDAVMIDGTSRSSALNGKIWADKSVTVKTDADGNPDGAFNVTLSTLGQTFLSTEETQSEVAYDVMLVLDFSGSMVSNSVTSGNTSITRAQAMVNAANAAIKTLMLDEDGKATNNRVGIVAYTGSEIYEVDSSSNNSSNILQFLPLDHYTTSDADGDFLEYNSSNWGTPSIRTARTGGNGPGSTTTYAVTDSRNASVTVSKSVAGGTPTQGGIFYAGTLLKDGAGSTTGVADSTVARVPAIILLTDGNPGRATSAYQTMATGNGATTYSGSAASGSERNDPYVAAYTILTANYVKSQVDSAYYAKYSEQYQKMQGMTEGSIAKFYTIGLGITENSWAHFMLNPSISAASDEITTIKATLSADAAYGKDYVYTDMYQGGENLSSDELTAIFQGFLDDIQTGGAIVDVGESTGSRNKMTFFDTLGEGVRLDGNVTLEVPTYTVGEDGEFAAGGARTYTLAPYKYEDGTYTSLTGTQAHTYVEEGGTVCLRPTEVTVNGTAGALDESNACDAAARNDLSVTVQKLASTGQWQIQAAIPSALMAYNVISSATASDGTTTYGYYSSEPVRLSYDTAADESAGAGVYYTNAPGQTYLHFNPSSAQNEDGTYVMPYYWTGQGAGDAQDKGTNATGTDAYVCKTAWGANNDVSIYLGNNGRLTLTGKDLTFNLHWEDNDNVDGVRFENISVQLYKQVVADANAGYDTTTYGIPEAMEGYEAALGLSNVPADDSNLWEYIFTNLPVYEEYTYNGVTAAGYVRYWLQFVPTGKDSRGYDVDLSLDEAGDAVNGHLYKQNVGSDHETWWFCFSTDQDLRSSAALDVDFTRARETVTYTITKKWDSAISSDDIPASIQIQLYANGRAVDETGEDVTAGTGLITLYKDPEAETGAPDYATGAWAAALTLPKNTTGGNAILYTPVEVGDSVKDFTVTTEYATEKDDDGAITGYTAALTNYKSVDETSLTVVKVWDDNDDQDGVRPDSVTFKLTAATGSGSIDEDALKKLTGLDDLTQELDKDGGDRVTWNQLPRTDASGSAVTYSAAEAAVAGYTAEYDATASGYVFVTNTHTPETVSITIGKAWDDADNQDGLRPTGGVSGTLYQQIGEGGAITRVRSWSSTGNTASITGLPKYSGGTGITYYVAEDAVNGYALTNTGGTEVSGVTVYPVTFTEGEGAITLTNTHDPAEVCYEVHFTWEDTDSSLRPETIQLKMVQSVDGVDAEYYLTLAVEEGEITRVTGITDKDGQPAALPGDIAADAISCTTDDETGVTALTIAGLPQYENGELAVYSVRVNRSGDYEAEMDGYTLTSNDFVLSYAPEYITLAVTKVWQDYPSEFRGTFGTDALGLTLSADGEALTGTAPDSVTVKDGNWVFTWNDMPKYQPNTETEITYSVEETDAPAANAESSTTQAEFNNGAAALTNVFDPDSDVNQMTVTVTKVWDDNGDVNQLRPGTGDTDAPAITLYKKGDENKTAVGTLQGVRDNGDGTWTYTWEVIPKYDGSAQLITYIAEETAAPSAYTALVKTVEVVNGAASGSLVNSLKSSAYKEGYLTIAKAWDDESNRDNSRPDSVTFDIRGQAEDGSATTSSTRVTVKIAADGTVTAENQTNADNKPTDIAATGSGFTFTIALPMYDAGGSELTYYVDEAVPTGYMPAYTATGEDNTEKPVSAAARVSLGEDADAAAVVTVTNTHEPVVYTVSYNGNATDVTGVPVDETAYVSGDTAKVAADEPTSRNLIFAGWTDTPYAVIQSQGAYDLIQGSIRTSGDGLTITGSVTLYAVWLTDANGNEIPDYQETSEGLTFIWRDESNRDGIRPTELKAVLNNSDEITVNLDSGNVMSQNADTWVYSYATTVNERVTVTSVSGTDGSQGSVVSGPNSSGYGYTIETDGTTVILTYSPQKDKEVTVAKTWSGMEHAPAGWSAITATIALYANGKPVTDDDGDAVTKTVMYTAEQPSSTVTWSGLYVNENGAPIAYTAVETGITATVDGTEQDVTDRFTPAYSGDKLTVTNTFQASEAQKTSFTFMQLWDDNSNAARMRPGSITVTLADESGAKATKTVTADDGWACTFDALAVLKDGADPENPSAGDYKSYHIASVEMSFSDPTFDNLYSNNETLAASNAAVWTATLNKTGAGADAYYRSIRVNKVWSDNDNQLDLRPASVAIVLKADGDAAQTVILDESSGWTATFQDLPVYQAFQEITYRVEEFAPSSDYTVSYSAETIDRDTDSVTVTNAFRPAGGCAVTYDGNESTGGSVPVDDTLYNEFNTKAVIRGNTGGLTRTGAAFLGWSTARYPVIATTAGYNAVQDAIYSAGEALTVTGDTTLYAVWAVDANGNDRPDYEEDTVNLTFTWDDQEDYDGLRPAALSITLEGGAGLTVGLGSVAVSGDDDNIWITAAEYLKDGTRIQSVAAPDGYTAEIGDDGVSVTLTHTPGKITFTITKSWANMDVIPASWSDVTASFVLYGNGKLVNESTETSVYSVEDDTTVTWAGLDKYEDGVAITYHAYETGVTAKIGGKTADVTNRFQVAYDFDADPNTITNTFLVNTEAQKRAFTFVQEWDDNHNEAGMRPSSLTVQLVDQDAEPIGGPVTVSAEDGWSHTWYDLPTYQSTDGAYAEYSVTVTAVTYTTAAGADVTEEFTGLYILSASDRFDGDGKYVNTQIDTRKIVTLDPGTDDPDLKFSRAITVNKAWAGDEQVTGHRPADVAIRLLAGGEPVQTLILNESGAWTAAATVPMYQDFEAIAYSVQEFEPSAKYSVTYANTDDAFTVTNTLRKEISADTYTITFVYENAYATDSAGGKIPADTAVAVPAGGTYVFTAHAEDGFLLSGSAVLAPGGSARMTVTGGNAYQVSNLTGDVTVTIRAAAERPDMIRVDYVGNNPSSAIIFTTYVERGTAAPANVPVSYNGYTFLGWYTADGVKYAGAPVTAALTLYAKWEKTAPPAPTDPPAASEYDLTVTKKLSQVNGTSYKSGNVSVGDELTYTITVKNTGDYKLTNITVTDVLPEDVALVDATKGYESSSRSGELSWAIASLGTGKSETFTVTVEVLEDAAGTSLRNTAAAESKYADHKASAAVKVNGTTGAGTSGRPAASTKPALNLEDHVAYIIGYVDGTVRPLNEITRSEVAAIFFRLLTDESRAYYWSQTNSYSDVDADDWFNNAVSTLSNAGVITGYLDGTFRPNEPITRAEFAAIAARFSDAVYSGGSTFSDVPAAYWAAQYISLAEHLGWVTGYVDGTFRPDQNITRAEAITMINRVLERAVLESGMLPDMVTWSDNLPGAWYYEAVQEATNSHEYTRTLIPVSGQSFHYESWQEILEAPDWAALEKTWSTANSR